MAISAIGGRQTKTMWRTEADEKHSERALRDEDREDREDRDEEERRTDVVLTQVT